MSKLPDELLIRIQIKKTGKSLEIERPEQNDRRRNGDREGPLEREGKKGRRCLTEMGLPLKALELHNLSFVQGNIIFKLS